MFTKVFIDNVWAGQRIRFTMVQQKDYLYLAFYNRENQMTIVQTDLAGGILQKSYLPEYPGWDSHHAVNLGVDMDGYIHVSGNMHKDPLRYYRSKKPHDITAFDALHTMVGNEEVSCTYPVFFKDIHGLLYFQYRNGKSGKGDVFINIYDHTTHQRSRLLDTPLLDGEGQRNAYPGEFVLGPDNYFHMCWVWRDDPRCETNHTLEYAKTKDFIHRCDAYDTSLPLPIRMGMGGIVDPIPVEGGILNGSVKIGFDDKHNIIISYHKFDENGNTQLYNARFVEGKWTLYQTSVWEYRRNFTGGGTIELEIDVFPVECIHGKLLQRFKHVKYGQGIWELDSATLHIIAILPIAADVLDFLTPSIPDRVVHLYPTTLNSPYILRRETYPPNRDKPRENIEEKNLSSELILLINQKIS